eukprot:1158384-Pelagomonas_calceolata.AAC.8
MPREAACMQVCTHESLQCQRIAKGSCMYASMYTRVVAVSEHCQGKLHECKYARTSSCSVKALSRKLHDASMHAQEKALSKI